MHTKKRPRLISTLLAFLIALVATVATSAPSYAGDDGPVIVVGGGNQGDPGGGDDDGGGGGGGGGGGSSLPPQAVREYKTLTAPQTRALVPTYGWKTCARKADGRYATKVSYIAWYKTGYGGAADTILFVSQVSCVYPPSPILSTIFCPLWLAGTIDGPYSNPIVGASTIANTGRKNTAFYNGGMKSLSQCQTSPWSVSLSAPMKELGRYKGQVQGQVARCVRRDYPQSSQKPDIKSCTKMPIQTWTAKAAVWCDGYSTTSWPSGHSYTMDECLSRSRGLIKCTMNGAPTYGGLTGNPVEAFHDGRNRTVKFPGLRVSGPVRNVKVTGTTFTASGTPMRDGVGANAATQPFVAGVQFGTKYTKDVTSFPMNFQSAGHPNDPFKVKKTSTFTAQFQRETLTARSINLKTGAFVFTTTTRWVTDRGTCVSKPLAIDVLRARNTN